MKHYQEINLLRSILIVLVILIHIVHFGALYPELKEAILAFMMPSFLVITGYLVNIDKSLKAFAGYLFQILLPYLILTTAYSLLSLYLPVREGLSECSLTALLEKVFVSSIGPYWFFYVMFLCAIAYYTAFRLPFPKISSPTRMMLFGSLLVLMSFFIPLMGIKTTVYYFFGTLLRQSGKAFSKFFFPTPFAALPFFGLITFVGARDWGSIEVFGAVIAFISFSNWICQFIPAHLSPLVAFLGMNTLPIYLFHSAFTMAGKFYLSYFEWDTSGIFFTFTTLLLSIFGSLAIAFLLDRTHLSIIFGRKCFLR